MLHAEARRASLEKGAASVLWCEILSCFCRFFHRWRAASTWCCLVPPLALRSPRKQSSAVFARLFLSLYSFRVEICVGNTRLMKASCWLALLLILKSLHHPMLCQDCLVKGTVPWVWWRITPHFQRCTSNKGQVRVKTNGGGNVLTYFTENERKHQDLDMEWEGKLIYYLLAFPRIPKQCILAAPSLPLFLFSLKRTVRLFICISGCTGSSLHCAGFL